MNLEHKKKEDVLCSARRLSQTGLVERTWGNVSSRLNADTLLITPTGASYDKLKPSDIVKVNLHTLAKESSGCPSSELSLHVKIYNTFPKANVILHTHQRWASILSLFCGGKRGYVELPEECEKMLGSSLFSAEYATAGTETIAQNVVDAIVENTSKDVNEISSSQVLMAYHGVAVFASDFKVAFLIVEELERVAKDMIKAILKERKLFINLEAHSIVSKIELSSNNPMLKNKSGESILPFLFKMEEHLNRQVYCFNLLPNSFDAISHLYSLSLKEDNRWCTFKDDINCRSFLGIPSYFDDTSQIAGAFCPLLDEQTLLEMSIDDFEGLLDCGKVFILKGVGIFFYAPSETEAFYMASLFEKNVFVFLLSLYDENITPLSFENALTLHTSYLKGYSRIKG